jgi:Ser/Thr protein kinase RdoA (MazF antagonist)
MSQPFAGLSPDVVLDACQSFGVETDGRLFALNSYENRVYQVGSTSHGTLVVKFYRPGRWSDAQIREEHEFALELAAAELPVAAPLRFDGQTLLPYLDARGEPRGEYRLGIFPKRAGRIAELDAPGALGLIGRTLGRIHARGALSPFATRPRLSVARLGTAARHAVLETGLLEGDLEARYAEVSERLLEAVEAAFEAVGPLQSIRIHGDCHVGNILWDAQGPVFVDLDDCMTGPRIQDLWMFLSGSLDERRGQWGELSAGYRAFTNFDFHELALIEPLRALRMLHHAAWLAARWDDPAFPRAFPWFGGRRYWEEHLGDLAAQCDVVAGPPDVLL